MLFLLRTLSEHKPTAQWELSVRCKGVVRKTVSHEVYYEILANQIRRMEKSFRFRCKGVVRNMILHGAQYYT